MGWLLAVGPDGGLRTREAEDGAALPRGVAAAFASSPANGMLALAGKAREALPEEWEFVRRFAAAFLAAACQSLHEDGDADWSAPTLGEAEREDWRQRVPPLPGAEYLSADALGGWWRDLATAVRAAAAEHEGGPQGWLRELNPNLRFVGRVTLHLAENKRDPERPFAFLATYVKQLSASGQPRHEPLARALEEHAGDRAGLLRLLLPITRAAERSELLKDLAEAGDLYHPLAWTPAEARRFLHDVPALQDAGLVVRMPDWWNPAKPPRPTVGVTIGGGAAKGTLSADSMLEFRVDVCLDGEPLTEAELAELFRAEAGLVRLRGRWVEIDGAQLQQALKQWQRVERDHPAGLSFHEGMRLLAGAPLAADAAADTNAADPAWLGVTAGPALAETLRKLRTPTADGAMSWPGLKATLRPYQHAGAEWLRFVTGMGLGACLADDMGLGKTVQTIALLLRAKADDPNGGPSLLAAPASLLANWQAELSRFAPSLAIGLAHPSAKEPCDAHLAPTLDLVVTTYGMLARAEWLRSRRWRYAILDEAQAIKNPGARQTKAVKSLQAGGRVALTGTPVENRLGDLWSLFDFLNPGLLGPAKAFSAACKRMGEAPDGYRPLRNLVQPYLLRRLKTDRRIAADLPDKTEVTSYCQLSKEQALRYGQAVAALAKGLEDAEGIGRKGLVLSTLMLLKQICNHPDQAAGVAGYDPAASGKFARLGELCEELSQRQERALVFTQFREIAEPLHRFLAERFGRPGLILHGGTPVAQRRQLVERFQHPDGPPYFVLSLKAGGTGLNLTAASQVIHFDRWWNPAVENQATDRAFRIGQTKNVLVHKFVCRGTVEERIDALLKEKAGLAEAVVEGGESLLTEMSDRALLDFVALDLKTALAA